MSRYFLSSLLLIIVITCRAQDQNSTNQSIRFGIDLSPVVLLALDPGRIGVDASLDYEFKPNYFAVAEGGWLNYDMENIGYNYMSKGVYGLVGLDYNFLKDEIRVDNDIVFVGFRYGLSNFQQQADSILFDNYWGTYYTSLENQRIGGQWFELVFGLKVELFFAKNFFIGLTLRAKKIIFGKDNDVLKPYIIPGYGKTEKNSKFGLNWFIAYRIPFKN